MKWSQLLNDYSHFLKIERGLSDNSIKSYKNDVKKLIEFLKKNQINKSPDKIEKKTIQEFIYNIAKEVNARSQARKISGLRGFFDYLIFENYRENNPMDLIAGFDAGRPHQSF